MNSLYLVHLVALIAGILAILLIRRKYSRINTAEFVIIIILYTALVLLFTEPVVNWIRQYLSG